MRLQHTHTAISSATGTAWCITERGDLPTKTPKSLHLTSLEIEYSDKTTGSRSESLTSDYHSLFHSNKDSSFTIS